MRYKSVFGILIIIAVLLLGCTKKEEATDDQTQPDGDKNDIEETENNDVGNEDDSTAQNSEQDLGEEDIQAGEELALSDIPAVPENTEEIINQTAGPYAGKVVGTKDVDEDVIEEIQKLDPLPEDASDEQLDEYFNYLYYLAAEDFPDPQDTIKKWAFGSSGNPDLPDARYQFKENYNIEVLLDASGSMGAYIGDKTMMQIAKESIHNFMKQVPEDANVSFRVYGHKGTGSNADKEKSCASIEQVYGYAPYDEEKFQKELDKIEPAGWTPLADVLKQAEEALKEYDAENSTNLIYVVSDGVETCDGDPVEVAKSLADSNAEPIINIIGFNVNSNAQKQLKEMAKVSGGVFATANNQEQLEAEFNRAEEVLEAWNNWKEDALEDADADEVENSFDIMSFTNDWELKSLKQFNNIDSLVGYFEDEEIINTDQRELFDTKKDAVEKVFDDGKQELEEELEDISADGIEDLKQSIKEKYDKQAK